ncbi:MAG: hypothetical protein PUD07_02810 [bacterium]|nr:hypothetical protein [bacterium]
MLILDGFCTETSDIWIFLGKIIFILKILIPVILLVLGIVGLAKAVIADDDKEIKTQVGKLVTKFIAAVCIFFLPSIVKACFGLVDQFSEVEEEYVNCVNYITDPYNSN